ncbi:hypothetical protein G9A89_020764 [Geosiphon pyriformis]|nr:hypothetical protein G9A89_020764 [Geosiphon pyriformis]
MPYLVENFWLLALFSVSRDRPLGCELQGCLLSLSKAFKMFKPYFVSFLSYAKTSVFSILFEFPFLMASAFSVAVKNSLVSSWLASLESNLAKLSVLVKSIVKPVGSMVKVFEQFVNGNLVSSSALGLRVNEVLVYIVLLVELLVSWNEK